MPGMTSVAGALICVALGLVFSIAPAPCADAVSLNNAVIRVGFGERGLVSIEDMRVGPPVSLAGDEFALEVDGTRIESATLDPSGPFLEAGRVVYRYRSGGYSLEAFYEVRPGWGFVSKQVFVARAPKPVYTVNSMEVFRGRVGEDVADARIPKTSRPRQRTGDYGLFLRLADSRGLFVLVQNPFLHVERTGNDFRIAYTPQIEWKEEYGVFPSDRGCLGLYRRAGYELPRPMVREWKLSDPEAHTLPPFDIAEVDAFTACVRSFLVYQPRKPIRVFVGWCVNDYQIDAGTPEGRTEYKRIIDRAAEMGAGHVLYAPTNSLLSRREESADSWQWENLLWLGLGQKIRRNEWSPKTDQVPPSVQEMLDYARSKSIKLVAYVYPVLPFVQNPGWLVDGNPGKNASLGFRSLQDFLIENLVAFARRTGLGGYAFDYTFFTYPGTGRYSQWWGWRRVLESLRRALPEIVIDGRQSYQEYGPWIWLAGSYPHPTGTDEQPESFVNFPDLHFDRVSADRQRYTAYWYRNLEFCPTEIMPGFITHQTGRNDDSGDMPRVEIPGKSGEARPLKAFRRRDWDYLGWRYSLISSIASAPWNNVINMIPARDLAEYGDFSRQDIGWFRKWLDWADANREILRHTRSIVGEPAIGRVDGTAAVAGGRGFIFLFNPNGRRLKAEFTLDASIGLREPGRYLLREIYPLEGRLAGKPGVGSWTYGDKASLDMDGTSALVLELAPFDLQGPVLFNVPGKVRLTDGVLSLTGVRGEAGTRAAPEVALPSPVTIRAVRLNGRQMAFTQDGSLVRLAVRFEGEYFPRSHALVPYDPAFAGGSLSGFFSVPSRILLQLSERRKAWPIPWTPEDYRSTWLVPERLLLHVQIAEPDDRMAAALSIDGNLVELKKAYSSVHSYGRCFTGFYADVSALAPGREHSFTLELPPLKQGQFQGLYFDNVETEYTDRVIE